MKDALPDTLTYKAFKDPLPDTLTYKGVTLWGVIDIGYVAQTAGTPLSSLYWGLSYQPFLATPAATNKPVYSFAPQPSIIGIKIDEDIGAGWRAIGGLDTAFDPLTGGIADACASIVQNNGKPASQQVTYGDGARCGQAINGDAWAGVRNPLYGEFTFGRQSPLAAAIFQYDPLAGNSLSLLGWTPSVGAGQGISEAGRWDNSARYRYDYGPVHAAAMYTQGAGGYAIQGHGYDGNIGLTWKGFSVDGVYTVERDGLSNGTFAAGTCGGVGQPSCNTLKSTAVNTDGWMILTKYTYEFGGSIKDKIPPDRITAFAGYEDLRISDPTDQLQAGITTSGGYTIGAVTNNAYLYGDKYRQVAWGGLRYETGPWTLEGAYYHIATPYYAVSATSTYCSNSSASNCAAATQSVSAMAIYAVSKHLDVYSGVVWNSSIGGFLAGATVSQATTSLSGIRLKF